MYFLSAIIVFFLCSSYTISDDSVEKETYIAEISLTEDNVNNELIEEENVPLADMEAITLNSADKSSEYASEYELEELSYVEDYSDVDDSDLMSNENADIFSYEDLVEKTNYIASEKDAAAPSDNSSSAIDLDSWELLLVNKMHPIPDNYDIPLTYFSSNMQCDERVLEPLMNMLAAARTDGVDLVICSPYRDYALQSRLFTRKINEYLSCGYSYIEAYKIASRKVIVPGASEHQLGIAFDIVTGGHSTLDYEFADTKAGKWLKNNGYKYGFILRYPRGKEYITGIEFEPWHYRYVGIEAATYIMENEITLEEFIEDY